jgi:hypothetical protein
MNGGSNDILGAVETRKLNIVEREGFKGAEVLYAAVVIRDHVLP